MNREAYRRLKKYKFDAKNIPEENWDEPWRYVSTRFFAEMVAFFYPTLYEEIDWERGYTFLDTELKKITPTSFTGKRLVDKLVQVFLKSGKEVWLIIHIEIQAYYDNTFPKRMFTYNIRAFDYFDQDIVSLAILADDHPNWRPDHFGYSNFGCSQHFEFPIVKLLDYAKDWEMLKASDNPFAMVVMCHLKSLETHKKPLKRLEWKLELAQFLQDKNWAVMDIGDMLYFLDWLMILPESLAKGFDEEMQTIEQAKETPFVSMWERRGLEKGRVEGRVEEQQNLLLKLMQSKFGILPEKVPLLIESIPSYEKCDLLFDRALAVNTLEEMQLEEEERLLAELQK